jgi:hypothetical protein
VTLKKEINMPLCEVCNKNKSIGVASVPGVPYSAAYCKECLEANAHPLFIIIANTACCGGLDKCSDWWKEIVNDTLKHLNKTLEWFNKEVELSIEVCENETRN